MIEAIWYGFIAVLTFTGILALLCFLILKIFRTDGSGKYMIIIPADADFSRAERILFGAYVRNIIFGGLVFNEVLVIYRGPREYDGEIRALAAKYGLDVCM